MELDEFVKILGTDEELDVRDEQISPNLEIAQATIEETFKENNKALLFKNTGTSFPVLTNIYGSQKRIDLILESDKVDGIIDRIDRIISEFTNSGNSFIDKLKFLSMLNEFRKWKTIDSKNNKCQEVVMFKPELSRLPVLKNSKDDEGKFITSAIIHTYDPVTDIRNIEICRAKVIDEETLALHLPLHSNAERHLLETTDDTMAVVLTIGGDPIYSLCATLNIPEMLDKYYLAGFIRDKGIEMADCMSQNAEVPADSDIVIEGFINLKHDAKISEGKYGNDSGYYKSDGAAYIMHLTAITHKNKGIYTAEVPGCNIKSKRFIHTLSEKITLKVLNFARMDEIIDIYWPQECTDYSVAIVKIKKIYSGQAAKVAHTLWGSKQLMHNKFLIITDSDIDIRDINALSRYIQSNYSPRKDTLFSRGYLNENDQSVAIKGYGGKICIDATFKEAAESSKEQYTSKSLFIKYLHKGDIIGTGEKIAVIVNDSISTSDPSLCLSAAALCADAIKGSSFARSEKGGNVLVIDATTPLPLLHISC